MSLFRKTQLVAIDKASPDTKIVKEAVSVLARGGVIVYPTDTIMQEIKNYLKPRVVY